MSITKSKLPGFTPISDRIFVRDKDVDSTSIPEKGSVNPPTTIIVYGWGDGVPKHVAKYTDGYHKLFPTARIVMVTSPTLAAAYHSLDQRTRSMLPLVDLLFPTPGDSSEKVLMHVMSNTGGIFAAATFNAYQRRHGRDKALPHHLLVSDSMPGSPEFGTQVGRWATAMTVGTAGYFPWPFTVTRGIWWSFLYIMYFVEKVLGRVPSGAHSCAVLLDTATTTPRALRLYMYSKSDEIIGWEDLEAQVAIAKSKGYTTILEMFEGSPHVGHMRMHPDRYWGAIEKWWKESMALEGASVFMSNCIPSTATMLKL
ncbi:DUF829-domain-containing protein [Hypoxylon sp. FL1284]|nr:DUF829-domain-containing protein [Hypoxylon sp. FL1284]